MARAKTKEISKYNDIVIYYENQGNFIYPKGTFYAWLYDVNDASKKIESGEFDYVLFPMGGGMYMAHSRGYVPPLLRVWKKDYQKDKKGIEHLLGIVQGFYDEENKKMYVDMMTTNPKFRRQGINGHIIKQLREEFKVGQEDVIFDKPTKEGSKFMESGKYDEGGEVRRVRLEKMAYYFSLENKYLNSKALSFAISGLLNLSMGLDFFTKYERPSFNKIQKIKVLKYRKELIELQKEQAGYGNNLDFSFVIDCIDNQLKQEMSEGGEVNNEYFIANCSDFGYIPNELGQNQHKKLSDAFETLFDFLNGENGLEWMKVKGVIFSIEKNYIDKDGREKFKQVYKISGKEALDLYNKRMLENGGEIPDNIISILKEKRVISDRIDESSKILNEIANSDERPMGLVSERVKSSKEYINAKREYDDAFAKLRSFNSSEKAKTLQKYLKKKDIAERIRINKMRFNNGGTINQSINTNIMDNYKFNQLPHIDTLGDGDNVVIHESVFAGHIDNPKHIGERYIHCKVMGQGGVLNSLKLQVVKSVGTNAMRVGEVITRPITNILTKGRKLFVEPIGEGISKFKEGGLNPDNKEVKQYFAHGSGNVGGVLVGKRHSEGGIKAINKSTNQPLEMEGGEVVITRGAVSNPKKYDFEGKEMTTREILSKLNVDGGGVSFAEGGDIPQKIKCGCKHYKFGGREMSIDDFVKHSESEYEQYRLQKGVEKERKDHYETLAKLNAGSITIDNALTEIAKKEMSIDKKYPFSE